MTSVRTIEYGDAYDLLEVISDSVKAIQAFGSLVEFAHRSSDDLRNNGYGIYLLLKSQCDDLEYLQGALRREIDELRANKLEIRNPDRIAEWAGTSQYVVNRVISIATGIYLGPPTAHHPEQAPHAIDKELGGNNA